MTDVAAWTAIHDVLRNLGPTRTFKASGAIKAGQVVAYSATGVTDTVVASVAESGGKPVGVALYDIADGKKGAICLAGCEVTVAVADDTTGVDAGNLVETNDNALKGMVSEVNEAATGGATVTTHPQVVGVALEDIAGGGTGKILLTCPSYAVQANSS